MSKLSQLNPTLSEGRPFASMSRVNPHAAGVDLGAHEIMVCVPGDESTQLVRSFGNYTADLQAIAAWLKAHHIETVATESTGIYWIPLFETLEAAGFRCHLISACRKKPSASGFNSHQRSCCFPGSACWAATLQLRLHWNCKLPTQSKILRISQLPFHCSSLLSSTE